MKEQVNLKDELHQILDKRFGHNSFREGQEEVISSVLNLRDTLVIKSTGGGKSLCYQLPSLVFKGITVVISPLISLMEDQVSEARKIGRRDVLALHGGVSYDQREQILRNLNKVQLLYLSPEGIQHPQIISALKKRTVSLFVVDEAHCISQWGHDFRTDYLELAPIRESLGNPVCLAMTATATDEVKRDIIQYTELRDPLILIYTMDRKNIAINVEKVASEKEKNQRITQFISSRNDAGMIYFSSRAKAEELTFFLLENGVTDVAYYHGGMSSEERHMIQQQFLEGELRIICATNAFGMGVNKADIRYVIHYHFPSHLESYVQEMGRCSRDEKPGLSYLFAQEGDEQIPYRFIEQEFLSDEQVRELVTILLSKEQAHMKGQRFEHGIDEAEMTALRGQIQCSMQALKLAFYHLGQLLFSDGESLQRELSLKLEAQRQKRMKKIAKMYYWLQLDEGSCRRKFILNYFSETPSPYKANPCCDLCGLERRWMEQDIEESALSANKAKQDLDWQAKLHKLWPIK
jgi:ATP-dependent DNA helicase RecQ